MIRAAHRLALPSVLLVLGCASTGNRADRPQGWEEEQRENQIMVLLKPAPEPIWTETYASLARTYEMSGVVAWTMHSIDSPCVIFETPPRGDASDLVQRIGRDHRVELAQRVQTFEVLGAPDGYNDPYHHLQHGARSIRADAAHRWVTGKGVRVAVIDTGVEIGHPELDGRIALARNFVNRGAATFTRDVHGTSVAGVIAAVANNALGIVGVAPDAEILALKACWPTDVASSASRCNSYTLALALDFAIGEEIEVLNLSIGGPEDPILARLLEEAIARDVVVVASRSETRSASEIFPSSVEGVISVGSMASGPARGGGEAGLVAPGVDILTTVPQGGYDFLSGSSFAAAHASGVVALLIESEPTLGPREVLGILQDSASPVASEEDSALLIDACGAVARVLGKDCAEVRSGGDSPLGR